MKTLLAALLLFSAGANAIPVLVTEYWQDNYDHTLSLRVENPPIVFDLFINDTSLGHVTYVGNNGLWFLPDLQRDDWTFHIGLNTWGIKSGGVTYYGDSFTIDEPTGPRVTRHPVPDSGASAFVLLLGGIFTLCASHIIAMREA
jgi:hypothetical protein